MTFIPIQGGSKARFLMDYDLPYSVLGKLMDKFTGQQRDGQEHGASYENTEGDGRKIKTAIWQIQNHFSSFF
jgi:hypothetical protein